MKSDTIFIALFVITLILFGYITCSLKEGFQNTQLSDVARSENADMSWTDAKGIIDAAQGVPNSLINNAPFPPNVGQTTTLSPVDLDANYEELKSKLDRIQKDLPIDVQRQIVNIAPYMIGAMIDKRTPSYAVKSC
jgi:hypothetical protein